jgi:hypothetical protein
VSKLKSPMKLVLLCIFSCAMSSCFAQQPDSASLNPRSRATNSNGDSLSNSIGSFSSLFLRNCISELQLDSSIGRKLTRLFTPGSSLKTPAISLKPSVPSIAAKPFFKSGGGYLNYNWSHRSGVDSSISWNNISQHLVGIGLRAVFAGTLPVMVTYIERQSNSAYFKDFRDIRIDLDMQQYRQLRQVKALKSLTGYTERLQDPLLPYAMNAATVKSNQFNDVVNDPGLIQKLIRARETMVRKDFPDTSLHYRDSMVTKAKQFVAFYDTLQMHQKKYERMADSLKEEYQQSEKRIRRANQLLSGKPLSAAELEELTALYGKNDKGIKQVRQAYSGLRSLSVGRTFPDYSSLTVQNVNVNGISVEYSRNNFYMAAVAGMVDFRIRDFLYHQQKPARQYLYAARVGYGTKEKDNVILTYFRGRKQLFGGSFSNKAADIQGVSVAGQFFIYKGIKVHGELAQSGIPFASDPGGITPSKPAIRLNDHSQRAYSIGFNAYIPETQTTAEGYYRHTGLNYQSFNSFQYNAEANSWALGLTQSLWKRQLTIQANFRKNDFVNPIVLQRYNANTVYKNLTVTFSKSKWPTVSVGYLPASQFTAVGNQVYENHYQSLTVTVHHQYKIGIAKGSSLVLYSRFYNDIRDSGLIYYNSSNFFWSQAFQFTLFSATVNIARMKNGDHDLIVMEEGVSTNLFRKINAGFAVKINNLNKLITKVGFNANTRISIKQVGELSVWMEQSYLPSSQKDLFRYESYNIGLTRYF